VALRTRQYEAFISYSHAGDSSFAAELQRILNRIARPAYKWWQWWPPRVFRDQTNLAAASDLGAEIENALAGSGSFVLLASTQAAASPWVDREVRTWCASKPSDRLFIALTSGAIAWDDADGDFDRARTNAIPPALRRVFDTEPLWVDFTGVQADERLSRDPRFVDGAATLAAAIRGTDKDAIVGEDVRQRRRTKQLVGGAIGLLTLLTVLAGLAAIYAFIQRNHADERARLATSRQLAAEAVVALDADPEQSLALATRAVTTAKTDEALDALRRSLRSSIPKAVVRTGTARVWDAQFSRDGRRLVTASEKGGVRIWDVPNPRSAHLVASLHAAPTLSSARFSRDGRFVVTAGDAGTQIWRAAAGTREAVASFGTDANMAAFSPDGRFVASAANDGLHLWSVRSERPVGKLALRAGRRRFAAVAFSHDGTRIAAVAGSTAGVWSVPAGRRLAELRHSTPEKLWDVAFRPDGRQVVTADDHGEAQVWQMPSGKLEYQLNGHTDTLQSTAFSSDGRFLVTASDDATARVWDVETRKTVAELLGHDGPVLTASFRPDGRLIATGGADGTLRLWSSPKRPILELAIPNRKRVKDIAFSPDGRHLVTASDDKTGRVWSGTSLLHVLPHGRKGQSEDWVESATFSRDGSRIVTAGDDGTAKVWSTETGSLLATVGSEGGDALYTADLSPDGAYVAAGGDGGDVRIWKFGAGDRPDKRPSPAERIDGVAFAPTGGLLASASWDGALRLWEVKGLKAPIATLRADRNPLWSVAFSPDGARVAAGGSSGSVWVWDVRTHDLVATLAGRHLISGIGFSQDGRLLVTAGDDGLARVFAIESGRLVAQLSSGADRLEAATFNPVRPSVAIAGDQGEAAVLDCLECRPLDELLCLAADGLTPHALDMLPRDARDAIDSRRRRCHAGR
jgi:WD40 repeat protein